MGRLSIIQSAPQDAKCITNQAVSNSKHSKPGNAETVKKVAFYEHLAVAFPFESKPPNSNLSCQRIFPSRKTRAVLLPWQLMSDYGILLS
ncbi:hypothetical protein CDAR_502631 [Caerostris darwini]|uniref:Uncharacterized protein n=1 Tax=Caerostris darwini TaxID=1538125 RepID=A0AAV4RKM0_9ARAC|nr:hypothetical protein CDAR_502631 [Caerostris darwini]